MQTEVINKTEYSDSMELDFGGTRKGAKIYFNASNVEEAKQRVSNMKEIALHAEKELTDFKEKLVIKHED